MALHWSKGWPRCAVALYGGDWTFYSVNQQGELTLSGKNWDRRNPIKGGFPVPRVCKLDNPRQALAIANRVQELLEEWA